jgi:hypothetical protein
MIKLLLIDIFLAIDNRIETSGHVMIKGRDIVIAGLFGLGPDREQLTNLTELKNLKFKLIAAGSMHVLSVTDDGKVNYSQFKFLYLINYLHYY